MSIIDEENTFEENDKLLLFTGDLCNGSRRGDSQGRFALSRGYDRPSSSVYKILRFWWSRATISEQMTTAMFLLRALIIGRIE